MIITDYASLITAALNNVHRSDAALTSQMDRLVQLAEQEIFRELPLLPLETSVSGTTGSVIAYPAGIGQIERLSVNMYGVDTTLDYVSPAAYRPSGAGQPCSFVVENQTIILIPAPAAPYSYTLQYLADLTPLTSVNTTNWLVLNAPDLYFYALNVQVAIWTKDTEEQAQNIPLYQRALDSVQRKDRRKQLPMRGGLQIRPRYTR